MDLARSRLGFFSRLTVQTGSLFLIATVVPLLFVGFFSTNLLEEELFTHVREVNLAHAKKVSTQIDDFFDRAASELRVLADSLPFRSEDWEKAGIEMERFLVLRKTMSRLELVDKKGDEKRGVSLIGGIVEGDRENLKGTQAFRTVMGGDIYLGELFFQDGAGETLKISVPVRSPSRNRVVGMLSGDILLNNLLKNINAETVGRYGSAFVVDENGIVIAHNDFSFVQSITSASHLSEVSGFKKGPGEWDSRRYKPYTTLTGEKVFGVHVHLQSINWGVIVEQPFAETMLPLEKLTRRLTLFLGAVLVLVAAIICLTLFFLIRPVTLLTRAVSRVAAGEMEVRVPVNRSDELGTLIFHFNSMSRALKENIDALNEKASALENSEKRYRNIFKTASVGIWEEDFTFLKTCIDGLKARGVSNFEKYLEENPEFLTEAAGLIQVKDVNPAVLTMYGLKKKEELFNNFGRTFTQDSFSVFRKEVLALAKGEKFFESEVVTKNPVTGKTLNSLMTISFPEGDSSFESVLVCMMDITARKRAEEEGKKLKNYLENIIDSMPSVIIGVDADGVVTQWNREARNETGVENIHARGRPLSDIYPQIANGLSKVCRAIQSKEVKKELKVPVEKRNEQRYCDITIYPLTSNL
ncbi:MAG: cache domain-containing protein, partial [Nitrospinota bacterium]